jgi:hypothetical protein
MNRPSKPADPPQRPPTSPRQQPPQPLPHGGEGSGSVLEVLKKKRIPPPAARGTP